MNSGMNSDRVRYPCAIVATERAGRRLLGVHVDPLVVAGGVGEGVDPILGDLDPVAVAQVPAQRAARRGRRWCTFMVLSVPYVLAQRGLAGSCRRRCAGSRRRTPRTSGPCTRRAGRQSEPSRRSAVVPSPSRGTTTARPTSPQRSSGTPMTAHSTTPGIGEQRVLHLGGVDVLAAGDDHVLDSGRRCRRSRRRRGVPTSPVWNQPSAKALGGLLAAAPVAGHDVAAR